MATIDTDRRPSAHTAGLVEMAAAILAASEVRAIEAPPEVSEPAKKVVRRAKGAPPIDFHAVEPHQRDMDGRLRNWAQWCLGRNAPGTSPMFRMAPPPPRVRREQGAETSLLDRTDATRIAIAVAALPVPHSAALNWAYIRPVSPRKACMAIGTTMDGLAMLLRDGRQMLINRQI